MSYEPYHRKYRPRTFSDVVGQDPVATTLRNALRDDRVANAFLFAGSRGVGKTSMARILAKALNCPNPTDGDPCGECESCVSIARGDDIDVIEVDGASNRGIDEIRAIRDNVGYAPSRARFKVYIIDEVHMLTPQAFNALLKTLEEPPPHVKFVFATTEAQAVLETIISRCQRFEFRRISLEDIVSRLRYVGEQEGLSIGDDVLREIAVKSEGGLRDSLSLLDQLVSFAGVQASLEDLDRVLGRIDTQVLEDILDPTGKGDTGALMDALDAAFEGGRDAEDVLGQVTELFREAMVRDARGLPGGGAGRRSGVVALVREHFPIDRLLLAVRLCLNARREIKLAGQGRLQLELTFLKIARSTDLMPVRELLARIESGAPLAASPGTAASSGAPSRAPAAAPRGGPDAAREASSAAPRGGPPRGGLPQGGPVRDAPPQGGPSRDVPPRGGPAPTAPTQPQGGIDIRHPQGPSRTAPTVAIPTAPRESPARAPEAPAPSPAPPIAPSAPPRAAPPRAAAPPRPARPGRPASPPPFDVLRAQWPRVIDAVREQKPRAASLVQEAIPERIEGEVITLRLPAGSEFKKRQLEGGLKDTLAKAIVNVFGMGLVTRYEIPTQEQARQRPNRTKAYDDPGVRKILDSFGGDVVSINEPES